MSPEVELSTPVSRETGIHGDAAGHPSMHVAADPLIDWLQDGESIEEFLASFPSASREHALAALDLLRTVRPSKVTSAG